MGTYSAMPVVVKICGLTNLPDALVAAEAGANALGFIFYEKSPRFISPEAVAALIRKLPPFVVKVGVFVDAPEDFVFSTWHECGLNVLQFHGQESPEYCARFGAMTLKAIRVRGRESLEECSKYHTDGLLLDTYTQGQLGGTGETFNWDLAIEARRFGRPIFLAGGLTPENVGAAVQKVHPYGVDVSSGVESSPGRKDHEKVRAFVHAARAAALALSPLPHGRSSEALPGAQS